ncbi:MAG: hypothetical protein VXY68_08645, partial [Candidatus Thermoplasmatota archaeon]|nr:hypothetical protein [Candidatus Thermoplasmatota archaeon]
LPEASYAVESPFESSGPSSESSTFIESLLETPSMQAPSPELMGMMLDGVETIEFPTGSGQIWIRPTPESTWQPKP